MKKITIISLGRLGLKLYNKLNNQYEVIGTYRSSIKSVANAIQFDYQSQLIPQELQDSDVLIFNLPPSAIKDLPTFELFINQIITKKFIFISSISVYGNQGQVNENDKTEPTTQSGKLLQSCEMSLLTNKANSMVIRPAGIYSKVSHPSTSLQGRSLSIDGEQDVNLISLESLSELIIKCFDKNYPVVNAVNTHHPSKNEYYNDYCQRKNLRPIEFSTKERKENKTVTSMYPEFQITEQLP